MTAPTVRQIGPRLRDPGPTDLQVARLALGHAPAAIAHRLDQRLLDAPDFSAALRCQVELARGRSRTA